MISNMSQRVAAKMKKSNPTEEAEKLSEAVETHRLIQRIGWPVRPIARRLFQIVRAARKRRVTARAARAYWYGERKSIPSRDMDMAREWASEAANEPAREPVVKEARDQLARPRARMACPETVLCVADGNFIGKTVPRGGARGDPALRIDPRLMDKGRGQE